MHPFKQRYIESAHHTFMTLFPKLQACSPMQIGDVINVQAAFEALLQEPLLAVPSKAGRPTLPALVRFLALKNLAALLAADDATAPRALELYAEALRLDAGDTVLWHRMGVLVRCPGARLAAPDLPCEP